MTEDRARSVMAWAAILAALATVIAAAFSATSARDESLRGFRATAYSAYLADVAEQREALYDNLFWIDMGTAREEGNSEEYRKYADAFWADMRVLQARIAADVSKVRMLSSHKVDAPLKNLEDSRDKVYVAFKCRSSLQDRCPKGQESLERGGRGNALYAFLQSGEPEYSGQVQALTDGFGDLLR